MTRLRVQLRKQRGDFNLEVDFALDASGITALFGRSGCGKSTLIELLAGLMRPDAGVVQLDDATLCDTTRGIFVPAEQRRIGVVFQEPRLFPHLSVAGNLRYGASRTPTTTRLVTSLDEVIELLGLEPLLARRSHALSGGERQRVALGRALLMQPRLLLLDEPMTGLDLARREELLPYFARLRDRLSLPIIYVSHQFEEMIRLANHVVLLDKGRVQALGTLADMSRHAALRAIVGPDAVGAVVSSRVMSFEAATGMAELAVGSGVVRIELERATAGATLQLQVLARDIVIATQPPVGLSVRNRIPVRIASITADTGRTALLELDAGNDVRLLARITAQSVSELSLHPDAMVFALIKSVSLRGHVFGAPLALDLEPRQ